jgi:hypothetical protein
MGPQNLLVRLLSSRMYVYLSKQRTIRSRQGAYFQIEYNNINSTLLVVGAY